MHRGNPYPRHPTYWGTEAWFWPGFPPWKMRLDVTINPGEPWDEIPANFGGVSFPGYHDPKPLIMAYDFLIVAGSPPLTLRVLMERIGNRPNYRAQWRCELGYNWTSIASTAYLVQSYPQSAVDALLFTYCEPVAPYTYTGPVSLAIRPATYAEGGSPY